MAVQLGGVALSLAKKLEFTFMRREVIPKNLNALPPVMTTPPTVTLGPRNGTSAITSSVLILAADITTGALNQKFRFIGDPQRYGSAYPDNNFVKNMAVTTTQSNGNLVVEFSFHGSKLELYEKAQAGKYRIAIDEGNGYKYVSALASDGPPADGGVYLRLVDFGSTAVRGIRLEYSNTVFGGVRIGPNDSVYPPTVAPRPRAIIIGDSFTEAGSSGGAISHGYPSVICDLLGWDCWNSGSGGTGYIASGAAGSGRVNFQGRVLHDVIAYKPDVIIIAGGINDESYPISDVEKAARLLFATIRNALPDTEIIILSNFAPAGNPPANRLAIRDVLKSAASDYRASFIDVLEGASYDETGKMISDKSGSWITGSGNIGAPQATGNASLFITGDGTHPNKDGHFYLGNRVASEILKIYNSHRAS